MSPLALTRRSLIGLLAGSAVLLALGERSWAASCCAVDGADKEAASFESEDVAKAPECQQCGMDRRVFARSRMVAAYADGSETGVCSLHCASMDAALSPDKTVSSLLVADYGTRELIDASKAIWVLGGAKRGVMTATPKWAFGSRNDALAFTTEFGGRTTDFEEARAMAMAEVERLIKERGWR